MRAWAVSDGADPHGRNDPTKGKASRRSTLHLHLFAHKSNKAKTNKPKHHQQQETKNMKLSQVAKSKSTHFHASSIFRLHYDLHEMISHILLSPHCFTRRSDIAQGTKDLAVASAGVSPYGVSVDGAVKSPISNAVEVVDEVAEAGRGINSYGTNVDHRLGHELEKH